MSTCKLQVPNLQVVFISKNDEKKIKSQIKRREIPEKKCKGEMCKKSEFSLADIKSDFHDALIYILNFLMHFRC